MNNKGTKFIAGLAAVCALVSSPAAAAAGGYENLSARIIKCAEVNLLKKIAVLEFSAKGGAGKSDSDYAAEKIGLNLAGSKKTALIERSLLARVLKEMHLSSAAGGMADKAGILKNMLSLDAVVTGTVFPDGDKLKVLARLIELKTGRVLLAVEAVAGRLPHSAFDSGFGGMELPEVPFPDLNAEWNSSGPALPRARYRDAPADHDKQSCSGRRRILARLNSELVDAKARYWAIKMKAPGFSRESLKRNPGSEIGDPGVKTKFYELLAAYYHAPVLMHPESEKLSAVFTLLAMEKEVSNECGLN
ncbi:MAG: hypothetical protein COT18_11510 [Elusimicrobia bacterium CG08_land_8_20_14_0_20_59_10]|nr:MAG: hypothetical protein COT18_11510 [Elusimicrobia bacterium CG08_land_8_20_14_0_20_59_10]